MIRWRAVVSTFTLTSLFALLVWRIPPQTLAQPSQPVCSITYSQDFNYLTFFINWDSGTARFTFDDDSTIDLPYTRGWGTLPHYYPYAVGGSRTYDPRLTINGPNGEVSCSTTIEIIHHPRISIQPVCSITYGQDFNRLTFSIQWSDGFAKFSFGDASEYWLPGSGGEQSFTHDYAYNVGGLASFDPTLTVYGPDGPSSCSTALTVFDP